MGLDIQIYRSSHGYDCTNGGISSKGHSLNVVNVDGPFIPRENAPAVMIVDDLPNGKPYPKLVPAIYDDEKGEWVRAKGWFMFGGNYGESSDSRFGSRILPIFDRKE